MEVIIIEDEKPAARRLQRMLGKLGVEVKTLLHSVQEAVGWLSQNKHPDLMMLDIQLSDGISFEIFEAIEVKSAIIFTTAYDEYALRAFKLNSIDYLLKPIDEVELQQAISKYQQNTQQNTAIHFNVNQIKELLQNPLDKNYKKRFTIKIGQHLKMISINEIECFYSENKATYIASSNGRIYLLDQSLEVLEDQLDPTQFFRVSRKYLVQINAIKDIITYTNSRLQLKLHHFKGEEIIVSREKVKDFKNWLE